MTLRTRLTQVLTVLREARPFGVLIVGILIPIWLSAMLASDFVNRARYAGVIWEIQGIAVVAYGIAETRRSFGHSGIIRNTIEWVAKFAAAFRRPTPKVMQFEGTGGITLTGKASLTVGRNPNRPVEERLAALEKDIDALRNDIQARDERIANDIRAVAQRVTDEAARRDTAFAEVRQNIDSIATGGLTLEALGLSWLILGLISASIPDELRQLWEGVRSWL